MKSALLIFGLLAVVSVVFGKPLNDDEPEKIEEQGDEDRVLKELTEDLQTINENIEFIHSETEKQLQNIRAQTLGQSFEVVGDTYVFKDIVKRLMKQRDSGKNVTECEEIVGKNIHDINKYAYEEAQKFIEELLRYNMEYVDKVKKNLSYIDIPTEVEKRIQREKCEDIFASDEVLKECEKIDQNDPIKSQVLATKFYSYLIRYTPNFYRKELKAKASKKINKDLRPMVFECIFRIKNQLSKEI